MQLSPWGSVAATATGLHQQSEAEMKPVSGGYADLNGIKLCHEVYREDEAIPVLRPQVAAYRNWRNHFRRSAASNSGSSIAANYPPRGISAQRWTLKGA